MSLDSSYRYSLVYRHRHIDTDEVRYTARRQCLVGTGRTIPPPKAIALRSDILTDAIAKLIQNQRWQKTYATKRQFRNSIAKVRAFLQELTRNSIETRDTTITR